MISKTTQRFREAFDRLPRDIQQRARESYKLFIENPSHQSLRFKKIHKHDSVYSVRINNDYRALGRVYQAQIIWFWIGSHAEYDKLLSQL